MGVYVNVIAVWQPVGAGGGFVPLPPWVSSGLRRGWGRRPLLNTCLGGTCVVADTRSPGFPDAPTISTWWHLQYVRSAGLCLYVHQALFPGACVLLG